MNKSIVKPFPNSFTNTDNFDRFNCLLNDVGEQYKNDQELNDKQTWAIGYSSKLDALRSIEFSAYGMKLYVDSFRNLMDFVASTVMKKPPFAWDVTNGYLTKLATFIIDWIGEWVDDQESGIHVILNNKDLCERILTAQDIEYPDQNQCVDIFNIFTDTMTEIQGFAADTAKKLMNWGFNDDKCGRYVFDREDRYKEIKNIEADIAVLVAMRTPTEFIENNTFKTTDGSVVDLKKRYNNSFINELVDIAGEQKNLVDYYKQRKMLKYLIKKPKEVRVFLGDTLKNNFADAIETMSLRQDELHKLEKAAFDYFRANILLAHLVATTTETKEIYYTAFVTYLKRSIDKYIIRNYSVRSESALKNARIKHFPLLSAMSDAITRDTQYIAIKSFMKIIDKEEPVTFVDLFETLSSIDNSLKGSSPERIMEEFGEIREDLIDLITDAIDYETGSEEEKLKNKEKIRKVFIDTFEKSKAKPSLKSPRNIQVDDGVDDIFASMDGDYAVSSTMYDNANLTNDSSILFFMGCVNNSFGYLKL